MLERCCYVCVLYCCEEVLRTRTEKEPTNEIFIFIAHVLEFQQKL